MRTLWLLSVITSILYSCSSENKPTVVYPEDSTERFTEQQLVKDTTLILTGELPIHFDETDYLLFPIGPIKVYSRGSSKIYFGSGSSGSNSFSIGYLSSSGFSGDMDNVMIQHLDSSELRPLTTKTLKIRGFSFLKAIHKSIQQQIILLEVTDSDTNRDGKLTDDDIESLYISELNGPNFRKISPDFHELLDWKVVEANHKLYFRTIEDTDRNGEFNKKDKIHHFSVDLQDHDFTTTEYNPLKGL